MKPSSIATAKAIRRRKNTVVEAKPIVLDPNFPSQNAFVEDVARYIDAQCSRRAGKSNGLALRFFKTMEKYPGSQCVYLSLTRESALNIMWPVLHELNDKYSLGCKFVESKLIMNHPNGSKLRLLGADMKNFVKRLKGIKSPGVAIDETQDFGVHLQSLIDDVITPMMADYIDSWLALTGTPGPVPKGYFFDVTHNRKYGFSHHEWTLLDNPYMPNPQSFIEDLKLKRGWDDNNPTLLREWRNKWVLDVDSLWIKYKENINDYKIIPELPSKKKLNYILGVDIGFRDADALAVIGWHESLPQAYLVEELITPKQSITDLVEQIERLNKKYEFHKMVMDEGGLGKKIGEELRRQKSIPIHPADKALKQQNVAFLNDALMSGKFRARASSRFAEDSYLVQIDWEKSTPDKIVIKKQPHSDIIDAVLYAFKECPIFAHEYPKQTPKWGTKEWAEAQPKEMFEREVEHLKKISEEEQTAAESLNRFWNMGYDD